MEKINQLTLIIGRFLLSGIFLLNCVGYSMAQTAPTTTPDHLKFKIVATDAQTLGVVTSATTTFNFGVLVTNDSSNNYGPVTITSTGVAVYAYPIVYPFTSPLANYPNPVGSAAYYFAGPEKWTGNPFSSHVYSVSNNPAVVPNINTQRALKAVISMKVTLNSTTTYNTVVEDVIYTPSNTDLIPMIVNTLNNVNNAIKGFWNQLTNLQNGENYIVNQESQLQSGENYIVNQEKQTQAGENYIVNQESQLQAGENYIVNQDSQIEYGETEILNRLK